ncbi:MAG: putative Ig domain-containing protein, partial [Acidobacteria bacterium]|nr:putative Ig domain-containing protein [Acidobacteriota bacterium]
APESDAQRSIPFDYTFKFELKGEQNRTHRSVVTVSVEASFTAVSIGYGVIPRVTSVVFGPAMIVVNPARLTAGQTNVFYNELITQNGGRGRVTFSVSAGVLPAGLTLTPAGVLSGTPTIVGNSPITIRATDEDGAFGERDYVLEIIGATPTILFSNIIQPTPLPSLRNITINNLFGGLQRALTETPDLLSGETGPEAVFGGGIRLNPQFAELALLNDGRNQINDIETLRRLFQAVSAPSGEIQFLYALFDDGSGREFQSEPLLNTAGLGTSNGDRPFRYFAHPITFAPRSTIRMEVTEKSDFQGELHVSLHGYKVLGTPGTPTAANRPLRRRGRR